MNRNIPALAAFFLEVKFPAVAGPVVIRHIEPGDGRDTSKAVDHNGDDGSITQGPGVIAFLIILYNRVKQLSGLFGC